MGFLSKSTNQSGRAQEGWYFAQSGNGAARFRRGTCLSSMARHPNGLAEKHCWLENDGE
jgi:hypothetical protein